MTAREMLEQVLTDLPEERVGEVLDFARFVSAREEREAWREAGRANLRGPTEKTSQTIPKRTSSPS